ncbi:phage late control D family protein, partial [Massilia kyonggiensis]|nr:phage late control D family protein [Massilia kyonggiensis]
MEVAKAGRKTFVGAGTVRTFVLGTTFTLHDHSLYDGDDEAGFIILRVSHLAHNNQNADTGNALQRLLGELQCGGAGACVADGAGGVSQARGWE